ncbi:helix-turn-helix domain-containing protein [Streptococcus oriscaviae]|uniref:Helix-turn-helix domain-containing protein n=1 Tax=Streptococcus oriscaviae TaxID=2781599 RepID=A0ABX7YJG1_9STRE|nr:helix-turn-helix domain-containing protein [Streptococcus oriscaviae]QUE53835.1 helix-turn-helix domain-containing protein [Streptococcus oriscaviae]
MQEEGLKALFPEGKIVERRQDEEGMFFLPLSEGRWFSLAIKELTARERVLLGELFPQTEAVSANPWYRYFVQHKGDLPQPAQALQFIHVYLRTPVADKEALQGWLDMMAALLPNQLGWFQASHQSYVFVLEQSQLLAVREVLQDTLSAMEFDFGLSLTIFLGQVWPQAVQSWQTLYQAEHQLLSLWLSSHQQSKVLGFGQLYLWGLSQASRLLDPLQQQLALMIASQEELSDSILALWEETAVVTKAAQRLYIHRNTLNYRLDKWQELTGLELRNLTDLALCYQVLQTSLR